MTIHKLRILPIFLLITGLTLTSGCKKKDMSLKLNEPRNIRGVVSYKRSFPDLNDKHLKVAPKQCAELAEAFPFLRRRRFTSLWVRNTEVTIT